MTLPQGQLLPQAPPECPSRERFLARSRAANGRSLPWIVAAIAGLLLQDGVGLASTSARSSTLVLGSSMLSRVRAPTNPSASSTASRRASKGPHSKAIRKKMGLLSEAAKRGNLKWAEKLCLELQAVGHDDIRTFTQVISAAAKSGNLQAAEKWFFKAKRPNLITYTSVLAAAAVQGNLSAVDRWISRLQQANLTLNRIGYNTLINAAASSGNLEIAEMWFATMTQAEIVPNIITYNTLLKAAKANGDLQAAERWYDEMFRADIEPDAMSLATLIAAAAKAKDSEAGLRWFEEFEAQSIEPTCVAFSALLNAYSEDGDYARAQEVCTWMREAGLPLRDIDYTCLLKCCAVQGSAQQAENVFRQMLASGVKPTKVTLATLGRALHDDAWYQSLLAEFNVRSKMEHDTNRGRFLTAAQYKWNNAGFQAEKKM